MIKTVLFDLEGTLINSDKTQVPVLKELFKFFKINDTDVDYIKLIGPPLICTFEKYFGKENSELAVKKYLEIFNNKKITEISKVKDIDLCLNWLKQNNIKIYTVSLQMQEVCEQELKILNLYKYFDKVFADNKNSPYYSKADIIKDITKQIELQSAVMVGDTVYDYNAATDCGLKFIGVKWGYGLEELKKQNIVLAENISDLTQKIQNL